MSSSRISIVYLQAPLTTTFTPPSGCLDRSTFTVNVDEISTQSDDNPHSIYIKASAKCLPSGYWAPFWTKEEIVHGVISRYVTPFSPGLICPSGFITDSRREYDSYTTSMWCCPSSYQLIPRWQYSPWCERAFSEWMVYYNGTVSTSTDHAIVYFPALAMERQPSDFIATTYMSQETRLPAASAIPTIPSPTNHPNATETSIPSSPVALDLPLRPRLSTGATVGVAIGSFAGLILVLSALLALMRYLRARRNDTLDHPSNLTDFFARGKLKRRSKLGPQEMEGKSRPAETDAGNVRAELEGEWRGNEIGEADK